jgi:hypothetical protein
LKHLLSEDTVLTIVQNDEWMSLICDGILKQSQPFQIDPETGFFDELAFYKIKDGMSIAEIGAGDGMFCLLLGLGFDSLAKIINDIDPYAVEYATSKISRCKSIRSGNRYFSVEGKKKSTKLELVQVNKIIIRN